MSRPHAISVRSKFYHRRACTIKTILLNPYVRSQLYILPCKRMCRRHFLRRIIEFTVTITISRSRLSVTSRSCRFATANHCFRLTITSQIYRFTVTSRSSGFTITSHSFRRIPIIFRSIVIRHIICAIYKICQSKQLARSPYFIRIRFRAFSRTLTAIPAIIRNQCRCFSFRITSIFILRKRNRLVRARI